MVSYSNKNIENAFNLVNDKAIIWISDFVDPAQLNIFINYAKKYNNISVEFNGGFKSAERQRVLLTGNNYKSELNDFQINALTVEVSCKNHKLKHGDFLGAILGLGIKREKLGDLFFFEDVCYVVVDQKIARYIHDNLAEVSKYKAIVKNMDIDNLPDNTPELIETTQTVASLRLDSIVKLAWSMSRSKASELIKAGAVKLNWEVNEQPAKSVHVDDVISVKGKGRIKILEVKQVNKKGRTPVVIGKYR